jgi:ABC-2 type transport system permease protein
MTVTTIAPTPPVAHSPSPTSGTGFAASSLAVARRTVRKFVRTPQLILMSTVQGVLFLLIFRYVFGGAIDAGGLSYVAFLVPGFITTTVLFAGTGAAVGVAEDIQSGFFDRLRSLPIPRAAAMVGRALADTGLLVWTLAVTTAVGFATGFRLETDLWHGLAAFGLCVLFGFAFEWLFVTMGLVTGNAQAAQGMSMLVFPLTFVSSAYVPVSTMPGWMQAFAEHQPITVMVNAVRCLTGGAEVEAMLGHSTAHYVGLSVLWAAGLIVVFAPLAIARFARR